MSDTILVVGAGAMACLFVARLTAAGYIVLMVDPWKKGLAAIHKSGVTLEDRDGNHTYQVSRSITTHNILAALVLVKSWQTDWAATYLAGCLAPSGEVLTLQNGLGNVEILASHLGDERVSQGVTTVGATLLSPGRVYQCGEGGISLGDSPGADRWRTYFKKAGFKAEIVADTKALVWGKLVVNTAVNPLTAILQVPNGELLACPSARELMGAVATETASVASALGINLPFIDPTTVVEDVVQRTANNISSMLQDVRRRSPTEIDAINGAVVKRSEAVGVSCPLNRTLWSLVKSIISKGKLKS